MGLFFFILSVILYGLCHWLARRQEPEHHIIYEKNVPLQNNKESIHKEIEIWAKEDPKLQIIGKDKDSYRLEHQPSLTSFGYYYYIEIKPTKTPDFYIFNIKAEAKFVGLVNDRKLFRNKRLRRLGYFERRTKRREA